ncbi:somatomedin-B and thrombospondin type-1 domain-containing protein [Hetaerina americana]|uniref:somatomedin-B and thrombospondin type-1 domain-containing protein n=1 Tax=Hetaerina americana TaxID=62018 RepID=UPI003A7F1B27
MSAKVSLTLLVVSLAVVPPVLLLEDHHHHAHHHQQPHGDIEGSISASPAAPPASPAAAPRRSTGSCRESRLCCPGRDSSCVVQKAPLNAIIEDLSDEPCYCDHACIKLGDCCSDFKEACGVVDCEVSEWGTWSECDAGCGPGRMTRSRSVVRFPENGGRHCPSLVQKRGCQGTSRCGPHSPRSAIKETAMLLPASLSASRHVNETSDIRRNLRLRYPKDPSRPEYCVQFEVLKAAKACRKENGFASLREGERVCARCEKQAQREPLGYRCSGHGVGAEEVYPEDQEDGGEEFLRSLRKRGARPTRWGALSAPHCHGKWIRVSATEGPEPCPCSGGPDYIFV